MPLFAHELLVFGSCLGEKVNRENRKEATGQAVSSGGRWS
jgi:Ca2+-transporting ATPase